MWYDNFMQELKEWTRIFKGLANLSRLRIIATLSKEGELSVSEIAQKIHVTIKGTSKHLSILADIDVLDRDGRAGHVYYSLNKKMSGVMREVINRIKF